MKKLLRTLAAAFIGIGLSAGVAAAQTGTIGTTGPNSNNQIMHNGTHVATVVSTNTASVGNNTGQRSSTGDAKVKHNTTGGNATSGAAMNASTTSTSGTLSNAGAAAAAAAAMGSGGSNTGTINNTGPSSNNQVSFNDSHVMTVSSTNMVQVENNTEQCAESGDARVSGNTTGGNATSGAASNTSNTSTSLVLTN